MTENFLHLGQVEDPRVQFLAQLMRDQIRDSILSIAQNVQVENEGDQPGSELAGGVVTGAIVGVIEAYWVGKPDHMSLDEAKQAMHTLVDHYLDQLAGKRRQ